MERILGSYRMVLGVAAVVAAMPAQAQQKPAPQSPAAACVALARAALGDDVQITATTLVAPAAAGKTPLPFGGSLKVALPQYCKVAGVIAPRKGVGGRDYGIGFEIALPSNWNGRFLLQGGGGLNGSIRAPLGVEAVGDDSALARGFAVASHDSGHKGAVFDGSFREDQRAALDFAEASVRTVTVAAKAITTRYYRKAIAHSYMAGCSTGGRETMLAMQRYPEMFDGVVIGAPAMRTGFSNLGTGYAKVMFNQSAPRDAQGKALPERNFTTADRQAIKAGLLQQCDALDGLADGMIMNVAQCRFRPAALQCAGEKQDGCLSAAQVGSLERAFAGPKDASGRALYAPVPYDTGIVDVAGPVSGYIVDGRTDILGPPNREVTIDLDAQAAAIRADWMQRLTDTDSWTNLSTYLGKGGKVLFYHGVSDAWFSAFDTLDYWRRAGEANGAGWADASRFYMVPGMGHCAGGDAFDSFDMLGAVVDWVEQGKAPEAVVAHRTKPAPAARPLCPYPSYARFKGGDPSAPENFQCTAPTGETL
ncbi:tannase/feruloyl esterase family alpha/beta hydrolase [Sphingomonas hengshuiensis]|uniref:tannase/feruloyl esterase family alpha/beta hydrolase n=1 Tax=Sphingomonas hengshuiensis TaxID=1609977 RepID=UPI000695EAF6|nr:tannase/feruloyl esterase family alpha/beta hydrolase [Sphingomonas hengshuiensis]